MPDEPLPHEASDVHTRYLVLTALTLLLFIALALWGLAVAYDTGETWPPAGRSAKDNAASPALSTEPQSELSALTAAHEAELERLGPAPGEPGFARIPIEAAMQLIAERGLPNWGSEAATDRCAFLSGAVPRSPQAGRCLRGAPP